MVFNDDKSLAEFIWNSQRPEAIAIRNEINRWLDNIPDKKDRNGILTMLKRQKNQDVRGAYNEVYLHERLHRKSFRMIFHPLGTSQESSPDFFVENPPLPSFLMEATIHRPDLESVDMYPEGSGFQIVLYMLEMNDSIIKKLKKKGTKYPIDTTPFILEVNVLDETFQIDEAEDQLDTIWEKREAFRDVSAILVIGKVSPVIKFREESRLIRNPSARTPLPSCYPNAESLIGKDNQWR